VRRAVSLLAWFALLEALWAVLVGTRQGTELVAGLFAAALGAALAEVLRSLGLLAYDPDLRLLLRAWRLPFHVVFDVCVVTWVLMRSLAQRRRVRGEWSHDEFRTGSGDAGRWRRAFGAAAGTTAPNAVVVDVDGERALVHVLEPKARRAWSWP
jgi:hypothetical protein